MYKILITGIELIILVLIVFQIIYPIFSGKKIFYSFRKKTEEEESKSFKEEIEKLEKSIEVNEIEREIIQNDIKEKYETIIKLKQKINKNN